MYKFIKLLCFCLSICACNNIYALTLNKIRPTLDRMTCQELMLGLIKESSFSKKFSDKRMALEFYFERSNGRHVILKFVRRAGPDKDGIYANFILDLVKRTLKNIDRNPIISFTIKEDYIPFIADKCTPEENLYGNTGRLPEQVGAGD